MRSLLFVPGHDERKLARGLDSGADALIVDLEDSVPEAEKPRARETAAAFVRAHRERMPLFVRVNALSTAFALHDLAAVAGTRPFGIMLPKCASGRDVARVDACLSALEARDGVAAGAIRILALVTETPASMFEVGSYASEGVARLWGMMWGAEDLSAAVGTSANRVKGHYTPAFELARSLCLFGAAAANVVGVDAVYPDFRDLDGLREEAQAGAATGFGAKAAIHPAQVPIINEAFTPSEASVGEASAIVEAFARAPAAGAIDIGGRMFDRPHLDAARRLLARGRKP